MSKLREKPVRVPVVPPKTTGNRTERKEALQESVDKYLEAIETQIGDLKKVGKNALVIGGVIVAAYAITEFLLPSSKEKNADLPKPIKEDDDEGESMIWSAVKGAATTLLLTIAREKLMDVIDHLTNQNAKADS